MRLELVRWIDSVRHNSGWQSAGEYRAAMTIDEMEHESVGWVFHEDELSLALCQSRRFRGDDDRSVSEVLQIPKSAVLSRCAVRRG